jgi:hypothetical protein
MFTISYRFADRDLIMRFRGGGVGHKSTREATDSFKKDRDQLDIESNVSNVEDVENNETMPEILVSEPGEGKVEEGEEEDYGYAAATDSEMDESTMGDGDSEDEYFGPEDDGGAVDPDMEVLGYGDL